jgi:hypothetical protein
MIEFPTMPPARDAKREGSRRALLLFGVKALHTAIFLIMAVSVLYILGCGIIGVTGRFFGWAVGLVAVESVVFLGNGQRCPLTNLAKSLGATKGYVFDTFFPERWTRYTCPVFTSLLVAGLLMWAVRAHP